MNITYHNQFYAEGFIDIPLPRKKYYINEYRTVRGFTYLFKLLWFIEKKPELIDQISLHKKEINIKVGGWSALEFVCMNYKSDNLLEVAQSLIKYGANINYQNIHNFTPLHHVCSNHDSDKLLEIIDLLLKCGINPNCKANGWTALQYVCSYNKSNKLEKVVKLLVDAGTDVNYREACNRTALHFVCEQYQSNKLLEIVKILIDAGVNVNAVDNFNSTALLYLCVNHKSNKLPDIIQILLNAGANINVEGRINMRDILNYGLLYALCHIRSSELSCVSDNSKSEKLSEAVELLVKEGIILNVREIIKLDNKEIYSAILKYRKQYHLQIKPFFGYVNEEQIKLLVCFDLFCYSIKSIAQLYNLIYYHPYNIGALVSESNFASSFCKPYYSNKLVFLFNSKN